MCFSYSTPIYLENYGAIKIILLTFDKLFVAGGGLEPTDFLGMGQASYQLLYPAMCFVEMPRLELGLQQSKCWVLPLHHTSFFQGRISRQSLACRILTIKLNHFTANIRKIFLLCNHNRHYYHFFVICRLGFNNNRLIICTKKH